MPPSVDPLRPLKDQKALVTGANSGIGEACAIALGAAGAAVAGVGVGRRLDRKIEIGLPDVTALIGIFRFYLEDELKSMDLREIAASAVGTSMEKAGRKIKPKD